MTNKELFNLANNLYSNKKEIDTLKGASFSYAIVKNFNLIQAEIEFLQKMSELSDEYKAYDSERIALCEKFANKDENGENIKIVENNVLKFVLDESNPNFIYEIDALKQKYQEAIAIQMQKIADIEDLLQQDIKINLFKIKLKDIPQDISVNIMSIIEPLIED